MTARVALWWLGPEDEAEWLRRSPQWLSAAETARARRLRHDRESRSFAARRAALRAVMSRYLGIPPAAIELACEGLPAPRNAAACHWRFSLSRSVRHSVVAVTEVAVGVDVEPIRLDVDFRAVAQAAFADSEWAAIERRAGPDRAAAFFRIWTRKEALLKGLGAGFALDPRRFRVSGRARAHGGCAEEAAEVRSFRLFDLPAPAGLSAALAVRAPAIRISSRPCNPAELGF